jgi:hypothetical protein
MINVCDEGVLFGPGGPIIPRYDLGMELLKLPGSLLTASQALTQARARRMLMTEEHAVYTVFQPGDQSGVTGYPHHQFSYLLDDGSHLCAVCAKLDSDPGARCIDWITPLAGLESVDGGYTVVVLHGDLVVRDLVVFPSRQDAMHKIARMDVSPGTLS